LKANNLIFYLGNLFGFKLSPSFINPVLSLDASVFLFFVEAKGTPKLFYFLTLWAFTADSSPIQADSISTKAYYAGKLDLKVFLTSHA
jgi:hypothetical protein